MRDCDFIKRQLFGPHGAKVKMKTLHAAAHS